MSTDAATQQPMDLAQAQAIAALPPEMMLLKMENESIMSVARATPRDPMKIVGQLQQLIDAYPAAADEAIYSKPVGTVIEVTCGSCGVKYEVNKIEQGTACPACESAKYGPSRKVKKFAEGLSIRAAESIRSIYGYTRLATTTEELHDGKVKITGVLVDYAAGNLTSDERIVSPMYRSRNGTMTRTPEDRFLNVVVKAEKSKLRRDVILDNTPNIVKAMFRDACEKKMAELVAPEVVEQKILPAFAAYGITPEQLDKILGRPHKLGWRQSERLELRKILNALKNEETTVRELLDGLDVAPASATGKGASIDDLTKPDAGHAPQSTATQPPAPATEGPPQPPARSTSAPDDDTAVKEQIQLAIDSCGNEEELSHRWQLWEADELLKSLLPWIRERCAEAKQKRWPNNEPATPHGRRSRKSLLEQ